MGRPGAYDVRAKETNAMSNSTDPAMLAVRFDNQRQRQGITDPAKLVAAELHNITDVLLEILKEMRAREPAK
jgi:hypothetical protein